MKTHPVKILYILISLVLTMSAPVSVAAMEKPAYYRYSLNHNQGLCDDYIRSINQDAHGYVWVVSGNGLNRFNGDGFTKFTKENSGLTTNELNCVLQDPLNPDILWIGSRLDGLFFYDYKTGKIQPFEGSLKCGEVTALAQTPDGRILVTHYSYAPEWLDPASGELECLYETNPPGFRGRIWCSATDASGRYLYLGHEEHGLTAVDLKTGEFERITHDPNDSRSLPGRSVYSLYVDKRGSVWTGTDGGVAIYNPKERSFSDPYGPHSMLQPLPGTVRAVKEMAGGKVWTASDRGGVTIFRVPENGDDPIPDRQLTVDADFPRYPGLSSSDPTALFEDSYGNRWVGYFSNGLDVVNTKELSRFFINPFYPTPSGGRPGKVWSLLHSRDKGLWIGGDYEVVYVKGKEHRHYPLPVVKGRTAPVRRIYEDTDGSLLIGTSNFGAFRLDRENGGLLPIKDIDREVRDFVRVPGQGIIAATHNQLYRIDSNGRATAADSYNTQMRVALATRLLRDAYGRLWVGTFSEGIYVFGPDGSRVKWIDVGQGLPNSTVNDMAEDPSGAVWVATRDGVARCDPDSLAVTKVVKVEDGVHTSNFKAVECGEDGRVWISAEDALSCYDPQTERLSTYTRSGNTSLGAFTEGSSVAISDGRIIFGSLNGLGVLNVSAAEEMMLQDNAHTRVTEFLAHDTKSQDHDLEVSVPVSSGRISIPYNLNTFTIRFSDPDLSRNMATERKYNLKGVNEVWTNPGIDQQAVYRNLKPGTYDFMVSTRTFGGEWSEPENLLTITITPPVWLTWWMKLIYVVLILGGLGLVFYFYRYKINLEKNLEIERQNNRNISLLNEEKLMFYTNVTHELRTPLSLIVGPIEDLINSPDVRDDHRRKLHTIRTSSMRLLNLINGILEFRKTETRNRSLEITYGNLANLVREIALRFKELNGNGNVNIQIDVAEAESREVYFDREIVTTILNNLISNALKHTKEGTITVSLRPAHKEGVAYLDLSVADTGSGISPDELPHIFKRYYQSPNNKKVGGTGIGLALVKNLVELHDASVEVESEVGKGSRFTIRFLAENSYPAARHNEGAEPDTDTESPAGHEAAGREADERLTVLVVEDDEDVRDYIRSSLSDHYNVFLAEDGVEGLRIVREKMPDVVVSDIMMPRMDGIELCRTIKREDSTDHIPVILLTAKDTLLDKEEGYDSGADSYITKPFSAKLLLSRINNIIESRHRLSLHYLSENHTEPNNMNPTDDNMLPTEEQEETTAEESPKPALTEADRNFIDRFRNLIEENIEMQEIDIAFLTDKMCMSHSTLYRKVKSITGLTPNEFTRKVKLHRAVTLMRSGRANPENVSFLTGFNSPAYFRRVFRKEFGMSPGEYLEENRDDD